jgi:hypothetical protein
LLQVNSARREIPNDSFAVSVRSAKLRHCGVAMEIKSAAIDGNRIESGISR